MMLNSTQYFLPSG